MTTAFERLPILNIAGWTEGTPAERHDLAATARRLWDVGFLYLTGHGVSSHLRHEVFAAARAFFDLPLDVKQQVSYERTGRHRGYVPMRGEATDPTAGKDLKEAFDVGLTIAPPPDAGPAGERMAAPNLWPVGLPGFRSAVEAYFAAMLDLARRTFRMLAVGLELPELAFEVDLGLPIAQMRLLHYPPQQGRTEVAAGIGAHRDYEALTILAQDDVGGLEVRNSAGVWVPAPPVEDAFIMNIGEMLSRWTNDRFSATEHRVVNRTGLERYSVPFFFATSYDTVIAPLSSTVTADRPPRHAPVRAGDYLYERLHEIYGS